MTHGSLEADSHYDPAVFTGIQAYNQGLQHIVNYLGNTMYLNLSISPLFPSNYAHGRRIACDAYGSISDTEYTLNSLTYGWWLDHVYTYNDADNVVLSGLSTGENRARITSSVITGIYMTGDDYSVAGNQEGKDKSVLYLTNLEINRIARLCKAFRPVEQGAGTGAADMFVASYADTTYVAAFNYSTGIKSSLLDFSRIGLTPGTSYVVNELWTNTLMDKSDSWTETLPKTDARIYKIYRKTGTGINQPVSTGKFTFYPNPCMDKLEVKLSNDRKIKNIIIYSLVGVKVCQFDEPADVIPLNSLKNGIYLISASSYTGDSYTSSLVKIS